MLIVITYLILTLNIYQINLTNFVEYVLVNEYEHSLNQVESLNFDYDSFKKNAKRKIEYYFKDEKAQLETIIFKKLNYQVLVEIKYQIFNIPQVLKKEVGINEKDHSISNYMCVDDHFKYFD